MKVRTSPYERAVNRLSSLMGKDAALADELEQRIRADMKAELEMKTELTSLRAEVERLRTRGEALAKALRHDDTDARLCGSCTEAGLAQERCDVGCFAREQAWLEMTGAALAEWEKP